MHLSTIGLALVSCFAMCIDVLADETSIGCFLQDLNSESWPEAMPKAERDCVVVVGVVANGPAAGKLQPLDLIHAINGKKVTSVTEFEAALSAIEPGKQAKLAIYRSIKNKLKHDTVGIKTANQSEVLSKAMLLKDDAGEVSFRYDDKSQELDDVLFSLNVEESGGNYRPVLTAFYRQSVILNKLVFRSKTGVFEMDTPMSDVLLNKLDSVWQVAEFPLTDGQLTKFENVLRAPLVTVQLVAWDGKVEHELSNREWVAIKTASEFYQQKTTAKKD